MDATVIDLFAGVGGLSEGFSQAGFNVTFANEFDSEIALSYQRNHPETKVLVEDIAKVPISETLKQYQDQTQVIVGGPPCQGFSQKGKRLSVDDDRNYLFRYFHSAVDYVKPEYFVMENVPTLLTNNGGSFREEIVELFSKLGYSVSAQVYKASEFGVPQDRRRAIIIGYLGSKVVEVPKRTEEVVTVWDAISDLNYLDSGQGNEVSDYQTPALTDYQYKLRGESQLLYNHRATNHSKVALERLALIPPNGTRDSLPPEHRTRSIFSGTWARMIEDAPSVTITTRFDTPSSGRFTHPRLDRAITVREAARIQSFPDSFRFFGTKTSQMKQVGNAVPPKLAAHVASAITSHSLVAV